MKSEYTSNTVIKEPIQYMTGNYLCENVKYNQLGYVSNQGSHMDVPNMSATYAPITSAFLEGRRDWQTITVSCFSRPCQRLTEHSICLHLMKLKNPLLAQHRLSAK